jgi:hypothetical protein
MARPRALRSGDVCALTEFRAVIPKVVVIVVVVVVVVVVGHFSREDSALPSSYLW